MERDNGIRTATSDDWEVIDAGSGAIRIGGVNGNATLSHDDSLLTLSLESPEGVTVYARAAAMPDPNDWVREIELLASFDVPEVGLTDIAWDGTGIWFPDGALGTFLRRLNPDMSLVVDSSLSAAHSGNAVAYTPTGFWVDDWLQQRLYKLYLGTGATMLATSFVAPEPILGLSTMPDGAVCIGAGNAIYLFNIIEGTIDTLDLHQSARGLESIDSVLFVALGPDGIARLEGPPWHAEATYAASGIEVHGLAFDGTAWWLSVTDRRGETANRILRASLPLN